MGSEGVEGGGEAAVGGVCYSPPPSTHLNISRERDVEVFITGVKKQSNC